jgi:hypothetical protein
MKSGNHDLPDEMTGVVESRRAARYEHSYDSHLDNAEAESAFLTDELIDNFAIAGDAERCRARLSALAKLGVGEVASGFLNGEFDQMHRVGQELIAR